MHVYSKALEAAKAIPMNGGKEPAVPKKRASKKAAAVVKPQGATKGKRTRAQHDQAAAEGVLSDDSVDEGKPMAKKLKGEPTSDDEIKDEMKGESKEV